MPNLLEKFDSEWIKAGVNVKQNDNIKFLDIADVDPNDKDNRIIVNVAIIRNGEAIKTKKFNINATNFKAIAKEYGTNSDKWVDKEMRVNIVKRQNPKTGEIVPAVALSSPKDLIEEIEN